jgi:hypothetical protein
MPNISDRVTAALQEARIFILGSQIPLGFQFSAVFQTKFTALAPTAKVLNCFAYGFMLTAIILLVLPGSFHSLAEGGKRYAASPSSHGADWADRAIALRGLHENRRIHVAGKIFGDSFAAAAGFLLAGAGETSGIKIRNRSCARHLKKRSGRSARKSASFSTSSKNAVS